MLAGLSSRTTKLIFRWILFQATLLVLGSLTTVVSLKVPSCKVRCGPASVCRLGLDTPRRRYLLPPGAEGDGERLLGGGQRVGDLGDGLLPGAGQALRNADTHHAAGGTTQLGMAADGGLLLRG